MSEEVPSHPYVDMRADLGMQTDRTGHLVLVVSIGAPPWWERASLIIRIIYRVTAHFNWESGKIKGTMGTLDEDR